MPAGAGGESSGPFQGFVQHTQAVLVLVEERRWFVERPLLPGTRPVRPDAGLGKRSDLQRELPRHRQRPARPGDPVGQPDRGGYNVVIHEFTHKLDMANGDADGLPPFDRRLHPRLSAGRWRQVLDDAFERLNAELDLIEAEIPSDMDPESAEADAYFARLPLDAYAATDPGEFFAVSSEAFFVSPARLHAAFPEWYGLLAEFFLQDPLGAAEA